MWILFSFFFFFLSLSHVQPHAQVSTLELEFSGDCGVPYDERITPWPRAPRSLCMGIYNGLLVTTL